MKTVVAILLSGVTATLTQSVIEAVYDDDPGGWKWFLIAVPQWIIPMLLYVAVLGPCISLALKKTERISILNYGIAGGIAGSFAVLTAMSSPKLMLFLFPSFFASGFFAGIVYYKVSLFYGSKRKPA